MRIIGGRQALWAALAAAGLAASAGALPAAAGASEPLASEALPGEAQLPPLAGGVRFDAGDGVRLWYRDAGPRGGLPVVFLHGGPGEGSMVLQGSAGAELERRVRTVYFDQRGAGRSARPKSATYYRLDRVIEDIEALRRALGGGPLVLLGHSAGSVFALEYAARHPQAVAGLVLTGAVPDVPAAMDRLCERVKREGEPFWTRAVRAAAPGQRCNPFQAFEGEANQRWINRNMFPDPRTEALVRRLDEADGLANSGEMGGALWESLFQSYRFTAPGRLTMPLLVIDGGADHQTDEHSQRALVRAVRDGRFVRYRGAGHFPFAEQPRRFARDVAAFVRRLERARRRAS